MGVCGKREVYVPPCKSQCDLIEIAVEQNGVYYPEGDVDGFSSVDVNVSGGEIRPEDEGKVVQNGSLVSQTTRNINSNGTYDTTTNNSTVVNVPNSYSAGDEGKVVDNGALVSQTTKNINANGTYDTTKNNSAVVNVPNSYAAGDEGKVVQSGALVAQTSRSITENGTYDTTTNNSAVVNVPNSYTASDEGKVVQSGALVAQGSKTVTEDGTYDTTVYNTVIVSVGGGEVMTLLSYGHSTWNDFITAYNTNSIVYCRASSNANPGTGAQGRLAFMAYVNNADNPTSVEFQYYRSVSTKSINQQGDQVFVYTLSPTNGGTWTVTTREAATKIAAGTGLTASYSGGVLTLSLA